MILSVWIALSGCKSSAPPPPRPTIPPDEVVFLPQPTDSFGGQIDPILRQQIETAYAGYAAGELPFEVESRAVRLLEHNSAEPAVQVLLGQARYLEGQLESALNQAHAALVTTPGYLAAGLLAARAHERLGRPFEAFELYEPLGAASAAAAGKTQELRRSAIDIALSRLEGAVAEQRLAEAEDLAERLERWAPDSPELLEARLAMASAKGDVRLELELLRTLVPLKPTRERRIRLATLEVEQGDVLSGLNIWESLTAEFPDEPELRRQVDRAKFRWQVERLPAHVQRLGHKPALSRGDLASLLYWLVPQIRHTPVVNPPISSDILDHPDQQAILRVTGLGILSVDETLHKFGPNQPVTRRAALQAVLELLIREGVGCAGGKSLGREQRASICRRALACRLAASEETCLGNEGISGGELIDVLKQGLDLIEATE